jgi:hypothetical protein
MRDQINLYGCQYREIGSLHQKFAMLYPKIVLAWHPRTTPGSLHPPHRLLRTSENWNSLTLNLMRILFVSNHIYQLLIWAYRIQFVILQLGTDALLHIQKPGKTHLDLWAKVSACTMLLKVLSRNLSIFILI